MEAELNISLSYTPEVAKLTAPLYEKVRTVVPEIEWEEHAPYIAEINRLKKERNAIILGHNYMTPQIFHCVTDFVGDSLALARKAAETDADIIIMAGVHFMAETAKILSPKKTVIVPDMEAGCSLAESITAADVRALKEKYPGIPVVTYVNTSAEVKAECDICCTSGNAVEVIESLGVDKVICVPDKYLADYIDRNTNVEVIKWDGICIVHEEFTPEEIRETREANPGIVIIAHPECPGDVIDEADFAGSTAGMINYVEKNKPEKVMMVTECSMSDNIAAEYPELEFIRPCNMCPYMKKITLSKMLKSLQTLEPQVEVRGDIAARARQSVERMLAIKVK